MLECIMLCYLYPHMQVTLTTKQNSEYVHVYGQDAGETYVIFNTSSSVNISKYVLPFLCRMRFCNVCSFSLILIQTRKRLYRVYQKKGNPILACHCALITGCTNVILHGQI